MTSCPAATSKPETEEQLLRKVAVHAKEAHGIDVTPELAAQVKNKIKDR
ncbi:hypothetical protein GCM10010869_28000 [Mesorhizobium tianshanense]|nr:hypothetical protein GCM10010869_28000 [Mesorhizobium tianshanense]